MYCFAWYVTCSKRWLTGRRGKVWKAAAGRINGNGIFVSGRNHEGLSEMRRIWGRQGREEQVGRDVCMLSGSGERVMWAGCVGEIRKYELYGRSSEKAVGA